jgi:hypothetical protein
MVGSFPDANWLECATGIRLTGADSLLIPPNAFIFEDHAQQSIAQLSSQALTGIAAVRRQGVGGIDSPLKYHVLRGAFLKGWCRELPRRREPFWEGAVHRGSPVG